MFRLTTFFILIFQLHFFSCNCSYYWHYQTLLGPGDEIRTFDITGNNQRIVTGSYDNEIYIYQKNQQGYFQSRSLNITIEDTNKNDIDEIDITNDGKWLLIIIYSKLFTIFHFDGEFKKFYSKNGSISWAGAISNDHRKIIITYEDQITVSHFRNDTFFQDQKINSSFQIRDISLTSDSSILLIHNEIYLYNSSTTLYDYEETIPIQKNEQVTYERSFITTSGKYICFSGGEKHYISVYMWNAATRNASLFYYDQFSNTTVTFVSLYEDGDKLLLGISTKSFTMVCELSNNNCQEVLFYNDQGYYNKFTQNGQFFIIGGDRQIVIYKNFPISIAAIIIIVLVAILFLVGVISAIYSWKQMKKKKSQRKERYREQVKETDIES